MMYAYNLLSLACCCYWGANDQQRCNWHVEAWSTMGGLVGMGWVGGWASVGGLVGVCISCYVFLGHYQHRGMWHVVCRASGMSQNVVHDEVVLNCWW